MLRVNAIFAFVFGRIFLIIIFFSMFEIIFSFCIQLSDYSVAYSRFSDSVNVITGIMAFVVVFSMISFILYWFLLLPENHNEENEFMSLKFENMFLSYPIIYLFYQCIFILLVEILSTQSYTIYLVLTYQSVYFVFILIVRPYNTVRIFNRILHNFTIAFNQALCILVVGIVMKWN